MLGDRALYGALGLSPGFENPSFFIFLARVEKIVGWNIKKKRKKPERERDKDSDQDTQSNLVPDMNMDFRFERHELLRNQAGATSKFCHGAAVLHRDTPVEDKAGEANTP